MCTITGVSGHAAQPIADHQSAHAVRHDQRSHAGRGMHAAQGGIERRPGGFNAVQKQWQAHRDAGNVLCTQLFERLGPHGAVAHPAVHQHNTALAVGRVGHMIGRGPFGPRHLPHELARRLPGFLTPRVHHLGRSGTRQALGLLERHHRQELQSQPDLSGKQADHHAYQRQPRRARPGPQTPADDQRQIEKCQTSQPPSKHRFIAFREFWRLCAARRAQSSIVPIIMRHGAPRPHP